ncbi:MAG: methyltransferase domain-containing protein [Gemmatimonadetes bacterium]|nr:methyltransferase domain-containing protein [Gemmatimonadota bacterium]
MRDLEERNWWFRAKRRLVYALLNGGALPQGARVLDVGCGTGATLLNLPAAYRGLGLDPSTEALALCAERGLGALVRGSATAIPLADATVDGVLALDALEHIDDDSSALREIARVLRPSGVAILTVPAFPFLWSAFDEALHHRRRYTRRLLARRIEGAGLEVLTGGFGYATIFPAAAAYRLLRRWADGRRAHASHHGGAADERRRKRDFGELPSWADEALFRLLRWEVPLVRRGLLPVGLSLVYVVAPAGRTGA